MADVKGKFVWYDLMTTDMDAAAAFYNKVVGWDSKDSGMPDQKYVLFSAGDATVAGLMPAPEGAHPHWMGYIGVDDADAWTQKVKDAGGTVHREPWDIPGVGRMSVMGDPQGAGICLFTPKAGSEGTTPPGPNASGFVGWNELHSSDGDAAFEFYTSMFGWPKTREMDMGPMGKYHIFEINDVQMGGVMTKPKEAPFPPMWLFYFNVDAIDAAVQRIQDGGGKVLMGPHEVPGGTWIVQALDPQGGMFALAALKR